MGAQLTCQEAQVASSTGSAQVLAVPRASVHGLLWIRVPYPEMGSTIHNQVGKGIVMTNLSTNTVLLSKYSRCPRPKITTAFRNPEGATVSASNHSVPWPVYSAGRQHQLAVVKHWEDG